MRLEVITGVDYITQSNYETMLCQAEVLMSNGIDVFSKTTGLDRYKDFFDSFTRYQQNKIHLSAPEEKRTITPIPDFLEG